MSRLPGWSVTWKNMIYGIIPVSLWWVSTPCIVFGVDRGGETGGHKVIRNGQTETGVMRHLVLRIRGILIVQWDDGYGE